MLLVLSVPQTFHTYISHALLFQQPGILLTLNIFSGCDYCLTFIPLISKVQHWGRSTTLQ